MNLWPAYSTVVFPTGPSHATTPSPCWAPHFVTPERIMFFESLPEQAVALSRHDDERRHAVGSHFDSWSLSHLGYLYPGTTPFMIKLDHSRSCPWV